MTLAFTDSTSSLSQQSLEDIFLPFLNDTSSQQWKNTDFQVLTSENFYTKSVWESSQEKLTQALSGLIPKHRKKQCEDYDQEVNNAINGLEEEIILLYDKLASFPKEEWEKHKPLLKSASRTPARSVQRYLTYCPAHLLTIIACQICHIYSILAPMSCGQASNSI